tara:strand:- start:2214 stop:4676 length:2463 start_codon:yes stop_codon:yes gene_type:complete
MALPVWLPFALQAGSMVSSGIGNYLEGKNQEKYYNRVTKMQQEAQRRRRESERKAGMANIFFGLGGRAPMQPVYQEEPEIDPYESSGAGRLWRGLGTGLGYAATAVSAYDTIRNTMISQAQQAGAKAGAAELTNVISNSRPAYAEIADQSGFVAATAPEFTSKFQPVEHFSDVLGNLSAAAPDSSGMFSGWFADARKAAFDEGYATSIGTLQRDYQGKLFNAMQNQRQFDLSTERFEFDKWARTEAENRAQKAFELQEQIMQGNKQTAARELINARQAEKREVLGGMVKQLQNPSSRYSVHEKKFQAMDSIFASLFDDPEFAKIVKLNKDTGLWEIHGDPNINAFQFENLLKKVLRLSSDEAVMRDDILRLAENMNTLGEAFNITTDNWMQGILDIGGKGINEENLALHKKLITNENLAGMLNILQAEKDFQAELMSNAISETVGAGLFPYVGSHLSADGKEILNIAAIGYTDIDQATEYLNTELMNRFMPEYKGVMLNAGVTGQSGETTIDAALSLADGGTLEVDVWAFPKKGYTNAQWEDAKSELAKAWQHDRNLRGQGRKVLNSTLYDEWQIKYPAFSNMPANPADWGASPKIKSRPFTRNLRGQKTFDKNYHWDIELDQWVLGDARVISDKTMELADLHITTSPLRHINQVGRPNNPLVGDRAAAAEHTRNTLLSFGANEAAIKSGMQSYQNALVDSNYAWGLNQTYPGLQDMYNPAMGNIAPGTGNFSAQEGQGRFFGGFGLGPAYEAATSVASQYAPRRSYPYIGTGYDPSSYRTISGTRREMGEDFRRVQRGEVIGRYRGPGGRYAPVPSYGR